ncbi:Uncharacterised protein [Edwardsiella tarda]|nr:Uncharacterised protein [Edwardsiella tarda]STD41197.1 Uncharacterised protein [Edwardsiella tarda]
MAGGMINTMIHNKIFHHILCAFGDTTLLCTTSHWQ